jgi:hypothetical protein
MLRLIWMGLVASVLLATALFQGGCRDDAPPPPRVPVPSAANRDLARERDYMKPMPPEDTRGQRDLGSSISVEPQR